jgi:hypothetical protein
VAAPVLGELLDDARGESGIGRLAEVEGEVQALSSDAANTAGEQLIADRFMPRPWADLSAPLALW